MRWGVGFSAFWSRASRDVGFSRGRAPAAGSSRPLRIPGRRGGQRARRWGGSSTFCSLADASGFARRAGWERPSRSFVLGFWLYGAGSPCQRRQRALGGRISDKANINLRKTLPLASRRPSYSRQRRALDRSGRPARSEPRISDHKPLLPAGSRRPCRLWAPTLRLGGRLINPRIFVGTAPKARLDEKNASLFRIRNPHIRPEL